MKPKNWILMLTFWLPVGLAGCGGQVAKPQTPLAPKVVNSLQEELQDSYLKLFQIADSTKYTPAEIQEMRDYLDKSENYCATQFKDRSKEYQTELDKDRTDLEQDSSSMDDTQRHDAHCTIQNLRAEKSQTDVLANHAIPVAYENKKAKLDLIEKWPAKEAEIKQEIASGSYKDRRWGDVKDIGFREIAAGQKDDIKTGEDAVHQMKEEGLMPKVIENDAITDYVNGVAERVAKHSDLEVPLHVSVLNSKEINAFALPGGYLFIERGLLEAAQDEAQLAGVIAHEIGHDVARHGHKLMVRGEIASIIYQAAQVAAVVLTGGVASVGSYYALQYGFYGLGLVMDLKLLGVSREYELEADQLGIQYAWNSGYDPTGFIRFFDKMATQEGYVSGISWFYDHPPFYQRMVDAEREIQFLPEKKGLTTQTDEFKKMKNELKDVVAKAKNDEKNAPSLLAPEKGCQPAEKIDYKPGDPIEKLCSPPKLGKTGRDS